MSEHIKIKATVHLIATMLVHADYDNLENLTDGRRLTATEIVEGVREYGRTLVMPPENAFDNLDVIEVEGANPREWSVNLNLWTAEEGQSDLTLELTLRENEKEIYDVEIDNIHVL
jgi:hypothetical protein